MEDEYITDDMLIGRDVMKQADVSFQGGKVSMSKIVTECEVNDESFIGRIQAMDTTEEDGVANVDLTHIEDTNIRSTLKSLIEAYQPKTPEKSQIEMKVNLTDDVPVYEKARHLSPKEKDIVNGIVQEWLRDGICRPSVSSYTSPVLLRPKKNGWRLCVDFRRLNRKVVRDRFPLPIMDDVIDVLQNAVVYSTIDLRNGFFHVPDGQYEFMKAPFGFTNSPAMFQRLINVIFRQLMQERVVAPAPG